MDISLTKDEALVLFELVSRFSDSDSLSVEHAAEEKVLWNIAATLEKALVEPFSKNYDEILEQARNRITSS